MSHLGRPKDAPEDKYSLKHILKHLSSLVGTQVKFAKDCLGEEAKQMAQALKPGEVLLLENLRFHKHETAGTESFAKELSAYGDVYVNDAFGTAHRAHASTTIVAKFFPNDKLFGYLMDDELSNIDKVLESPERPYTAIMGGAKVSGKITIINRLMEKVDHLVIGGGMAYTFAKAMGGKVGSSLVEEDKLEMATSILNQAKEKNVTIHLPIDTVIADAFSNDAKVNECDIKQIPEGWMGVDIGKGSIKKFEDVIMNSKTILWNGPMGVFEMSNFAKGTKAVAETVANATQKGAFSLVGGGDSVAAVNQFNLADKVSYVSTGGGALLEYMEGVELPGVKAIRAK
jgi:phosphoglycerate kinase